MIKQRDSLHKEGFRGENSDTEGHSSRKSTRECGPGAGPLQMGPNHWWYSHFGHRRTYRVLRLLTRKGIR